ncbi:MAG: nicotinate phosphoribosyltransferase [Gammaproteobacteria bacterium]|nr:nicotinate phosphoribosyltransferase [Gammaproteobacteria bacterium]
MTTDALLTDLYQLTMLQHYFRLGMTEPAVFEVQVRRLPAQRSFLLACGVEQVLHYLENLKFSPQQLRHLASTGLFHGDFLDYLGGLRFTGTVDAMPEGTVVFGEEPLLRVEAPLPEAQFIESRIINLMHFQTLIASKAARCVLAAPDKRLVDFGMRRAHGAEAALYAARASYIAGFAGTATVLANEHFGIPMFGTMAHSLIQAHENETEALANFARVHPGSVVLLIDTYDTVSCAHRVVALHRELAGEGIQIDSVRLDSGDLLDLSRQVRRILDEGGCQEIGIFASGNLDEYQLQSLVASGAPIDGFGVGTRLDASQDAPTLDMVYKLHEYAGQPRQKRSPGKATWPGAKQVFRQYDERRVMLCDTLALRDEVAAGAPLLETMMVDGRRLRPPPALDVLRARVVNQLSRLQPDLRRISERSEYPVNISQGLRALTTTMEQG